MTKKTSRTQTPQVAYFSMEIGLEKRIPTYSGGLGVLAGDTLRAAADQGISTVGVTLLHRKGYHRQSLDAKGQQSESPVEWNPSEHLKKTDAKATVTIEGRKVALTAWRYDIVGVRGHVVPVYFLDTDLPENSEEDRKLTSHLYGGDNHYRLCQEVVLGMGGVYILPQLGLDHVDVYHMNEGHSALLTLALLGENNENYKKLNEEEQDRVWERCVFTTHTPVPAGHDQFPISLVKQVMGEHTVVALKELDCAQDDILNMTHLALHFSRYVNGVAMRHGEVSRQMFPKYMVNAITNGVHGKTWTSQPFCELFDKYIPDWKEQNANLRQAINIPVGELWAAHMKAKQDLFNEIEKRIGTKLDPEVFTIGFARRATAYKRADLLFTDIERLKKIARETGRMQILYGGKAHPRDEGGKELIRKIFAAAEELKGNISVIYLEEYDMDLAKYLCTGVDLWLNTPLKPHEASGTSGMKAALNGVPSLSVLDGWWVEGHFEGVTGWSIGDTVHPESDSRLESQALYEKLEDKILPLYYNNQQAYAKISSYAVAINGSFFNTQRMIQQYLDQAYNYHD